MGKDYLGKDMRSSAKGAEEKEEKEIKSLDEGDIALLKTYGQGQYSKSLKQNTLVGFWTFDIEIYVSKVLVYTFGKR